MQEAEVVLSVLRERGRKGLPLTQLYRQMFNKNLYLLAYGGIYSNQGAMTPGASEETADGMSGSPLKGIEAGVGSYVISLAAAAIIGAAAGSYLPVLAVLVFLPGSLPELLAIGGIAVVAATAVSYVGDLMSKLLVK